MIVWSSLVWLMHYIWISLFKIFKISATWSDKDSLVSQHLWQYPRWSAYWRDAVLCSPLNKTIKENLDIGKAWLTSPLCRSIYKYRSFIFIKWQKNILLVPCDNESCWETSCWLSHTFLIFERCWGFLFEVQTTNSSCDSCSIFCNHIYSSSKLKENQHTLGF